MLDLSSDVVQNDENKNNNIPGNKRYKSKSYGKKDVGLTPIMTDSSIQVQSLETLQIHLLLIWQFGT